jgi:hypothetical protein
VPIRGYLWLREKDTMNWNRVLSSLVAVIYIVIAAVYGGVEMAFKIVLFLILPLGCIWFSDAMGGYTGLGLLDFGAPITQQSPGILVRIMGWVVLLLPVAIGVIIYVSS